MDFYRANLWAAEKREQKERAEQEEKDAQTMIKEQLEEETTEKRKTEDVVNHSDQKIGHIFMDVITKIEDYERIRLMHMGRVIT